MNELYIDMLAEGVEQKVQTRPSGTYDTRRFNIEFAKRIVDICVDLVEDCVDMREPASTYSNRIREHFGIETNENI